MFFLYALGAINLAVALYSLWGSFRYAHYARRSSPGREGSYCPRVALLVPCCGAEEGLEANLAALAAQDYPELRLLFIVENRDDPAVPVIERVRAQVSRSSVLIIAGSARTCGQKVHNLLAGVREARGEEVLAFADSDGRPDPLWLSRLVAALNPSGPSRPGRIGVATGYRFYLPEPASLASLLRSVWNAGVLTLLGDHDHNFAWGGSMAIRRAVFEEAGVAGAWQGALSDDYALTHAVRRAGYRINFVPGCLVGSRGKTGLGELAAWCSRQMAITRVYWPRLWLLAGGTQVLYTGFLLVASLLAAAGSGWAAALVAVLLGLTILTGALRARAVQALAPQWKEAIRPHGWAYALLSPLAAVLTVYGFTRSALSRQIEWRGKRYEMRSPTETVVLEQPPSRPELDGGAELDL